jgi:hypothetical protein
MFVRAYSNDKVLITTLKSFVKLDKAKKVFETKIEFFAKLVL